MKRHWRRWACREATGTRDKDGYAWATYQGVRMHAHRAAWLRRHGKIPTGQQVCHHCDWPPCIEIRHLWLGSQLENVRDMMAKNRDRFRGEDNGLHKLTAEQVREIRARYLTEEVTQAALAAEYEVNPGTIGKLVRGERWQHLLP